MVIIKCQMCGGDIELWRTRPLLFEQHGDLPKIGDGQRELTGVTISGGCGGSDGAIRRQYQKNGVTITEVQRLILAAAQNEAPVDVFLCDKRTDGNGRHTRNSLMAQ